MNRTKKLNNYGKFAYPFFTVKVSSFAFFTYYQTGSMAYLLARDCYQSQLPRDTRLRPIMVLALVLGVLLTLGSLLLFITPASFLQIWPWPITALLGRVFACWYLLMGLSLVLIGTIMRQPHEAVVPSVWLMLVNLLLLLLPLLYPATMHFGTRGFWLWIALGMALVVGAGWISIQCFRWMRASGQHL